MHSSPEQAIEHARQATVEGDWFTAEQILLQRVEEDSSPTEVHVHLGTLYAHQKRFRRAILHWETYLRENPANDWLIDQLIQACHQVQEWTTAFHWAQHRPTALEPKTLAALQSKARREQSRQQWKKRLQDCTGVRWLRNAAVWLAGWVTEGLVLISEVLFGPWLHSCTGPTECSLYDYVRFIRSRYPAGVAESLVYHKNREALIATQWLPVRVQGARILDLGSGRSGLPLYWSHCGSQVFTIDGSAYGVTCQQTATIRQTVPFTQGDVTRLPYRDNTLDGVSCICMLEHIPRDGDIQTMKEIHRVLNPGGLAVITVESSSYAAQEWIEVPYPIGFQKDASGRVSPQFDEVFCRQYSPIDLVERLIGSAPWDPVTDGYFDDTLVPLRRWLNRSPWMIGLHPFQPWLSLLCYRPAVPYHELSPSSIAYLVLRKPIG